MCGILGEIRFNGNAIDLKEVAAMRAALGHRGPDGEGLWHFKKDGIDVAFGHARLAIIDLSDSGKQPMQSPDGTCCITYNGEIYNYVELRSELKALGHRFLGQSDTEVLLSAYKQWGVQCLDRFNGMFSFAIWDSKRRAVFCARDRLGIKPFYYNWKRKVLCFASEIKALFCLSEIRPSPDPDTVYDYLSLGLMHHGDRSFFADICQIPAGCYMLVDASGFSIQRYWELIHDASGRRPDFDFEPLQHLLDDSVRLRLRSDVPVGILLSGGLDSSGITALAARHYSGKLQAFSVKFQDAGSDESQHARIVASHCGVDLHLLQPEGKGMWGELNDMIRAQDAPTHAPEVYSNWCMMRAVSKYRVKVLLTGQGGDELFAGYNWYPKHFITSLLYHGKLFTLFRELIRLPKNFPNDSTRNPILLLAWMFQALLPIGIKQRLKPELRCADAILRSNFRDRMRDRDWKNLLITDPMKLEEKMKNDLLICNVPLYLHYEDSNSMAFGIEERVPMLDHRLVEWAHQLAVWWRIRNGKSKHPLREVMRSLLPNQITNRRDKMGLSAPRDLWFHTELRSPIEKLFSDDCRIYEKWVNRETFMSHLHYYMEGKSTPIARVLWRCINLEKWLKCYT